MKMTDHSTPNLPSSDLERTALFYAALGFEVGFRDEGWMIMTRGGLIVEFVPLAVDPATSIASCCFRVDDLDALHQAFITANLASDGWSAPRLTAPVDQEWGMREFALIDPDGNLIRCLQNTRE